MICTNEYGTSQTSKVEVIPKSCRTELKKIVVQTQAQTQEISAFNESIVTLFSGTTSANVFVVPVENTTSMSYLNNGEVVSVKRGDGFEVQLIQGKKDFRFRLTAENGVNTEDIDLHIIVESGEFHCGSYLCVVAEGVFCYVHDMCVWVWVCVC